MTHLVSVGWEGKFITLHGDELRMLCAVVYNQHPTSIAMATSLYLPHHGN